MRVSHAFVTYRLVGGLFCEICMGCDYHSSRGGGWVVLCRSVQYTVPLGRTKVSGKKNTLWSRRAPILDPKFNEEHDARISFGHRARVQQPARARGRLHGRLPGRQHARAHASNEILRAHPVRSQNSDHACMRSCCMHARLGGRRHKYGRDCRTVKAR